METVTLDKMVRNVSVFLAEKLRHTVNAAMISENLTHVDVY